MALELLLFEIDHTACGVATSHVREVFRAVAVERLPEYPAFVEGGLNLHSEIIPVVDGRAILSRAPKMLEPSDHFILLEADQQLVAVHVDRAHELSILEKYCDNAVSQAGKLVKQVVNTHRGSTAILDVQQLIRASRPIASSLSSGVVSNDS